MIFGNNNAQTFTKPWRSPSVPIAAFPTGNTHALDVVSGGGNIFGINCLNPNADQVVLRFYDCKAAFINGLIDAAATLLAPFLTIVVPGASTQLYGSYNVRDLELPWHFGANLCVRCTAGAGDADKTNLAAAPILEVDASYNQISAEFPNKLTL